MTFDVIVRNGRWFDGTGAPSAVRHLGIRDGVVAAVSATPLPEEGCPEVIDATGRWVLPGFVDMHTHYDAEVLVAPGLGESVRHGVTTVVFGSCSLSTVHSGPEDAADLFSRVEAVPRAYVIDALERHRTWSNAKEYVAALERLPLGPNVAAFLGHSDLRTHVMGLGRAVDGDVKPTEGEMRRMEELLTEGLDAGLLGMSTMTTGLDKVDGDRYRSRSLPSTYATWREYRRLNKILRRRGRVLQSAPDAKMPLNVALFFAESMGLSLRRPLKTTLLVAVDSKSAPPGTSKVVGRAATLANRTIRTDLRWQHLPVPFVLYSDGIELPVFEEFGAGAAALHLREEIERNALMADEGYRRRFRNAFEKRHLPGLWHRDLHEAEIVDCPDASVIGKTFGQVAEERGIRPADAFLDLMVEHGGPKVRWRTTVGNHRPKELNRLATDPGVHLGFADSGAHLRNMAFYNFPLRLLKRVHEDGFMSLEHAVHRLTGELGGWFGLDAGTLRQGDRADFVVIDPAGLDDSVDAYNEEAMQVFGGLRRMVNRNDAAVVATSVGGSVVFRSGEFAEGFGKDRRTGRFLKAWTRQRTATMV